jgi:UDP-N-acetylmuramate: L-alanyl-gamma-D-glutamyl-meso-diaminopimelate ligase
MHIHIIGIGGTFMGGIAAIAKSLGHRVTGCDRALYPPMSTQLETLGIGITEGFAAKQLTSTPDLVIIGNVATRGMPIVEALLERGAPLISGPQWLAQKVLQDRWVLAVAGTHGKSTTSSMLAWILEHAGLKPGFLIGGVPANFGKSARLGKPPFFVIEADEYDTAFFDKRAKFVHYRPRTAILNNLEYDHADIYPDLASIQRQFHHLVRTIPGTGCIFWNSDDQNLAQVLEMGCWTPRQGFGSGGAAVWRVMPGSNDYSSFDLLYEDKVCATVQWGLMGAHNVSNALAAIAAARHAGVPVKDAAESLSTFKGIARRMEWRGEAAGVQVYDDFAHHPTAIRTTIHGLRQRIGQGRLIAVFEPRSATMKLGVHREALGPSLSGADAVWLYAPEDLGWDMTPVLTHLGEQVNVRASIDTLVQDLAQSLRPEDHVLIMSNGGFGGIHEKLLKTLRKLQTWNNIAARKRQ